MSNNCHGEDVIQFLSVEGWDNWLYQVPFPSSPHLLTYNKCTATRLLLFVNRVGELLYKLLFSQLGAKNLGRVMASISHSLEV